MSGAELKFELALKIEHFMAALSKLYESNMEHIKQEIIVNAKIRVHEAWTSDNWNGGTYGHALYLTLPGDIYLNLIKDKKNIQGQICEDLNKIHDVQNEFIAEVFFEMEISEDEDWREKSGVLRAGKN